MLLDVEKITSDNCANVIRDAILAHDPTARITISRDVGQVRVEGLMSQQHVINTLSSAGYPASNAAPHSGKGSDCCGGCS